MAIITIAKIAQVSEKQVSNIYHLKITPSEKTLSKLLLAVAVVEVNADRETELRNRIKQTLSKNKISVRQLSDTLGIDSSNLSKLLSAQRRNLAQLDMINNYLCSII
jgi:DNA-binding Xre family transcriptional regulator